MVSILAPTLHVHAVLGTFGNARNAKEMVELLSIVMITWLVWVWYGNMCTLESLISAIHSCLAPNNNRVSLANFWHVEYAYRYSNRLMISLSGKSGL